MKKVTFETSEICKEQFKYLYTIDNCPVCIGHLRGYLDNSGCFIHSWTDHNADIKTQEFKDEFEKLVNSLRKGHLKNSKNLIKYCYGGDAVNVDSMGSVGYRIDSENYTYYIRLNPHRGEYNVYIYCYMRIFKELPGGIIVVKKFPKQPWQGSYRVYRGGVHEVTCDTLKDAEQCANELEKE